MVNELSILMLTAASLGFFHTLFGPDHYLPFVVMSKAREWSMRKTTLVTVLCGVGHVMSSVLLGFLGVALGIGVMRLEAFESFRGNIAAWALIAFGLVYFVWGLRRALRNRPHRHLHPHEDIVNHKHTHIHSKEHVHVHAEKDARNITPWVLFTIFVFGPCEPLIPLLMYPAAKSSLLSVMLVAGIFGTVTITTMLGIVLVSTFSINLIPTARLERYSHALAGATIFLCGMAIQVLGL